MRNHRSIALLPILALAVAQPAMAQSTRDTPLSSATLSPTQPKDATCPTRAIKGRGDFSRGLQAMYSFSGEITEEGYKGDLIATLRQEHVKGVNLEINGVRMLILVDPTPLFSEEKFVERATWLCQVEALSKGVMFHIQFSPLPKPETPAEARRRQALEARRKREWARSEREAAQKIPDFDEVTDALRRDWDDGGDDHPGFAGNFAAAGSTFGEIYDLECARKKAIFTCVVGATYLLEGKPKYGRASIEFERDPSNHYQLRSRHVEEIILD